MSRDLASGVSLSTQKSAPGLRINQPLGLGGVAAGNAFHENSDEQIARTFEAAWAAGIRYFDTSPFYGYGLAERRLGRFLFNKNRDDYVLSTKMGRPLKPNPNFTPDDDDLWKGQLNFDYEFDYSAEGTRRSIEDSLQRMGLASFDIVFIHDISPDMQGDEWPDYFEQARKGAMPELERMREEGIIKGWGMGVNALEPILKSFEVANPNIVLSATQYSLMTHQDALDRLFPACEEHDVSVIIGSPINAGFLAGKERFDYGGTISDEMLEKRKKMGAIAENYSVDLRTASLQFSSAPQAVTSILTGASKPHQIIENVISMNAVIPGDFWKEFKDEGLIAQSAPEPEDR
jgi:D-threo-aldose 1-dehydrogenase